MFDDFSIVPNIAPTAWGVTIYLALTCTCIAYVLQNSALVRLSCILQALSVTKCNAKV
jgi:drug/metabolite transporter (DMT)-like permease